MRASAEPPGAYGVLSVQGLGAWIADMLGDDIVFNQSATLLGYYPNSVEAVTLMLGLEGLNIAFDECTLIFSQSVEGSPKLTMAWYHPVLQK